MILIYYVTPGRTSNVIEINVYFVLILFLLRITNVIETNVFVE